MGQLFKLVHNVETGEVTEIELSAQEITEMNNDAGIGAAKAKAEADKAALLAKLGITADEAKLLLS